MTARPDTGPIPTSGIAPLTAWEEAMELRTRRARIGGDSLVWLVSPHGGAGVSTLAQMLPFAGDGGREWPCVPGGVESPLCALVVRDSMEGLDAAHRALRQFYTEDIPAELLAVILVAANKGDRSQPVRRKCNLVVSLAERPPFGSPRPVFKVPWLEQLIELPRLDVPVVPEDYVAARKPPKDLRHGIHPAIGELATALRQLALDELPNILPR